MEVKKSDLIFTAVCKIFNYICWYLMALSFIFFINDEINKNNIIGLIISLFVIFILKIIFKMLYDKYKDKSFNSIKHNEEMFYFKNINNIKTETLESIDLNDFSNNILKASYYKTKLFYDLISIIIPAIIGLLILYICTFKLNLLLGLLITILLIPIYLYRYNNTILNSYINDNYLLKDFINKIVNIKKINVYDYFINKLDSNTNTKIKLSTEHELDTKYNIGFIFILAIILISVVIIESNNTTTLGYIIFYIILMLKLQNLIYDSTIFIKMNLEYNNVKYDLSKNFNNCITRKQNHKWKKIRIKNGLIKYTNATIKIPDFELLKGEHVSIMGAQGQGKSTILNILSGVYNLDSGEIFFDGKSNKNTVDAVYFSKYTELFQISLRDNLSLGKEITDEEIFNYLDSLNLLNWYNNLEDGLNTIMNMPLSKPILQKLNIIKAIILNKDIYFFDEPTNDLDIETEKIISNIIKTNFKNKTVIIVTHKPLLTTVCEKHYFMKNHTLLESEPLL